MLIAPTLYSVDRIRPNEGLQIRRALLYSDRFVLWLEIEKAFLTVEAARKAHQIDAKLSGNLRWLLICIHHVI